MTNSITPRRLIGTLLAVSAFLLLLVTTKWVEAQTAAPIVTPTDVATTATTSEQLPFPVEKLDPVDRVIGDFVVGPGRVELTLEPGQSKTVELIVSNRMGSPRIFKLETEDMVGSNSADQAVVLLGSDQGPYSIRDYVSFPRRTFKLDNMERARIPVTVSLPADAEPGGHYGSVLVSTVSDPSERPAGGAAPSSAIVSRIGTLFFVTTPGDVSVEGHLSSLITIPQQSFFFSGPINFALAFENTGSIHLKPHGQLSVRNMFGEEVGVVELDPWFALPQSVRTREVQWDRDFLFGRYTATAVVNRSYDDISDELSVSFWVIPWKLVASIFAGLFLVFLLIRLFFSRFEFKRR